MQFANVVGQIGLKNNLVTMGLQGRVGHAIMFSGEQGVGALPLALAYAAYLMCESPILTQATGSSGVAGMSGMSGMSGEGVLMGDSCGVCASCLKHKMMQHPDCHYVFPVNTSKLAVATASSSARGDVKPISDMFLAQWRDLVERTDGYFSEQELYRTIGIDNQQGNINKSEASEILRKMSFKSFCGGRKVVIMWLPERLHEAAANALLKLVEEPAAGTLFLFVTQHQDMVLSTIRSRCQIIPVGGIAVDDIKRELNVRFHLADEVSSEIARVSCGSWIMASGAAQATLAHLADSSEQDYDMSADDNADTASASEAVGQTKLSGGSEDNVDEQNIERFKSLMRLCYADKYLDLFRWAESMVPLGRETQKLFCQTSISFIRQCYMINIGMERIAYVDAKHVEFARRFAPYVNHVSLERIVAEFERLLSEIRQNGNPKILFPHFALMISKLIKKNG